jgi:hypothetical protein
MKITEEQIDRARKLYPFKELKGSITKGESNIFGALGEVIIHDIHEAAGYDVDFNSTYDYDLIIDGYKVDVKTKKFTAKFKPNKDWIVSISNHNTKQQCDYYLFLGISDNLKEYSLHGYMTPKEFYKKATFNKKGEIDPDGNGVWRFKDDCYNLKIKFLNQFKK